MSEETKSWLVARAVEVETRYRQCHFWETRMKQCLGVIHDFIRFSLKAEGTEIRRLG